MSKVHSYFSIQINSQHPQKNSAKKSYCMIFDRSKVTFNRSVLFSIDRTRIEQWLRHPETPRFFLYYFDRSSQSFDQSKMPNFEFSLKKFQNLNFHFNNLWNNILQTQISLLQHIHVYTYIYNKFDMCIKSVMNMQFNGYIFKKYSNINDIE